MGRDVVTEPIEALHSRRKAEMRPITLLSPPPQERLNSRVGQVSFSCNTELKTQNPRTNTVNATLVISGPC